MRIRAVTSRIAQTLVVVVCPAALAASFIEDDLNRLAVVENKFSELANATPAAQYSVRPSPRARSLAEVYLHVAAANFSFGRTFGLALPAGVNLIGYEQSVSTKPAVLTRLHESFVYYRQSLNSVDATSGDKPVHMFGRRTTVQTAIGMSLDHVHVHLTQARVYARLSQSIPPGSLGDGSGIVPGAARLRAFSVSDAPAPSAVAINVLVYNVAHVADRTLNKAEHLAQRDFQQAGIETRWIECLTFPEQAAGSECAMPSGGSPLYLELHILPRLALNAESRKMILGSATHTSEIGAFDTAAEIFFDQVDKLSLEFAQESGNGVFSGITWQDTWSEIILGTSIAHELGHLLLGMNHALDDSVMMPSFGREDFIRALGGASGFKAHQAVQLRNEVAVRVLANFGFRCPNKTGLQNLKLAR